MNRLIKCMWILQGKSKLDFAIKIFLYNVDMKEETTFVYFYGGRNQFRNIEISDISKNPISCIQNKYQLFFNNQRKGYNSDFLTSSVSRTKTELVRRSTSIFKITFIYFNL